MAPSAEDFEDALDEANRRKPNRGVFGPHHCGLPMTLTKIVRGKKIMTCQACGRIRFL